jgi:hypothetical protein
MSSFRNAKLVTWGLLVVALAAVSPRLDAQTRSTPIDDDPPRDPRRDRPALSVHGGWMLEGDAGQSGAPFTIRISAPVSFDVQVDYVTESGSALAGSDFEPVRGEAVIPAGATEATVFVPVYGDRILEANETFALRLTAATVVDFARSAAVGMIANDERTVFEPSGLNFSTYIHGILPPAWGDYDADGDSDLPLDIRLGRTFYEMPGFRVLLEAGQYHGGAWCDYDRDGWLDFALLPYGSGEASPTRTRLFHGGDPLFEDVAPALGMDHEGHGETAVWGDFDADGWPDLFAPFYTHVPPYRSFLWMNQRDGTFRDVATAAGVDLADVPELLKPEGAHAVDWNGDGYLDLYCASHLFLNDGSGVFRDAREEVGLPEVFDEGVQFGDYDGDGDFDLMLRTTEGPSLFRNDGGRFVETTSAAGLPSMTLFWGDRLVDVENDGDLDLYVAGPWGTAQLLLNQGNGTFVADPAFAAMGLSGSLSTWADIDRDGDLDVLLDENGRQLIANHLEQLDGSDRSYLRVRVVDELGRESSHGATVRLRAADGSVQLRAVDGGSGYLAQCEYTVHFAAHGAGPYALEIEYPSAPGERTIVDGRMDPRLGAIDPDHLPFRALEVWRNGHVVIPSPAAGVGGSRAAGAIGSPWPLPARRAVTVPFALDRAGRVEVRVLDVSGRMVRRLVDAGRPAGATQVTWDLADNRGRPVAAGVYFVMLTLDGARAGRRAVVVAR